MRLISGLVAVLMLSGAVSAQAAIYRLGFAGEIAGSYPFDGTTASGQFSGHFILDSSVTDIRPQPDNALYSISVIGGGFEWNGIDYVSAPGVFNDVFVLNDDDQFQDLFSVVASFEGPGGEDVIFTLQLSDSTGAVFSDDSFPGFLTLGLFDQFDIDDQNTTAAIWLPEGTGSRQGEITSIDFRVIPLPAGVWLFASALVAFAGTIRRAR